MVANLLLPIDNTNPTKVPAVLSNIYSVWNGTTMPIPKNQIIYVSDLNMYKIGDGTSTYSALPFSINASESVVVVAEAPTSLQTIYYSSGSVNYFTVASTANWIPDLTFSSTTTLNTVLAIGQAITCVVLVTQGATAYFSSAVQIDGTTTTVNWQGGTAPTAGNASGIDSYTYTIIKTAAATYKVLASLTQF